METTNQLRHANLETLVARLRNDELRKRDVIASANWLTVDDDMRLHMRSETPASLLEAMETLRAAGLVVTDPTVDDVETFTLQNTAIGQLRSITNLPATYFDALREQQPDLLAHNFTERLRYFGKEGRQYMLRTFSPTNGGIGTVRAVLSDRYKRIDNYDVLVSVLDTVRDLEQNLNYRIEVDRCDLTDDRMYIRLYCPQVEQQAPELLRNYHTPNVPDSAHTIHGLNAEPGNAGLVSGVVIGNSETGKGSRFVCPRVIFRACANGYRLVDEQVARVHLGSKQEAGIIEWSDETKQKELELIRSEVADALRTFFSPEYLGKVVNRFRRAADIEISNPVDTIRELAKTSSVLTDERTDRVLEYFFRSGDDSALGVGQAITFLAQQEESSETQFELEAEAISVMNRLVAIGQNLN